MADQNVATMPGRIYRVAPKGSTPKVPKLDLASPAGCVEALLSPNLSTRYLAWNRLHEIGARAEPDLLKIWNKNEDAHARARALQLLARIHGRENQYVTEAIRDANPDLR